MLIRYTGSRIKRRIVGHHEWSAVTGWVQDVAAALAAELLTGSGFEVDPGEPLLTLAGVNADNAGELALAGVGSLADLAGLSAIEIKRLARALPWASESKIKSWCRQAKGITAEPEPKPQYSGPEPQETQEDES